MGPNQDIPLGSDGICDIENHVPTSGNMDQYPLVDINFDQETITLNPGFNLISLPFTPMETSLPEALSSIEGNYDVILSYNSDTGHWESYNPSKPLSLNTLTELEVNRGYWIHITEDNPVGLIMDGAFPTNTMNNLKQGWNLIGYPSTITMPVEAVFENAGSYSAVWTFENGLWKLYVPGMPPEQPDNIIDMNPSQAYWVEAEIDVTWDFLDGKFYSESMLNP